MTLAISGFSTSRLGLESQPDIHYPEVLIGCFEYNSAPETIAGLNWQL
jgi:hypothetical protein